MPRAAVASTTPPVPLRQCEAQPASARTQLAGTFEGIGNTPCGERSAASRKRPADAPINTPQVLPRDAAPVAPPPRKPKPVLVGRAFNAAMEWHDLTPEARKQQTIGKFAWDHHCTPEAMLHWVDRDGAFSLPMKHRLEVGFGRAPYGRGPESAWAWNALTDADRAQVTMNEFAWEHYRIEGRTMGRYVFSHGKFKPSMEPFLPRDHSYFLEKSAAATSPAAHVPETTRQESAAVEPEIPVELALTAEQQGTLRAALSEVLRPDNGQP